MSSQDLGRYGLPKEVKFCKKCVISNQRPSSTREFLSSHSDRKEFINFGKDGICDACKYAELKENKIDWEKREQELEKLIQRAKRNGGYDVVVPGSGGKDSAYTAHILKYKYGMNPLTVTWAPHLYTEVGWENLTSWSHVGGLDNILFTPNGKLHRHLTNLAFINLLHPFQPFIIGQRIIGPLIALKFGIPLVMYGENQAEYGNKINENLNPLMEKSYFSNTSTDEIKLGGVTINEIIQTTSFKIDDFSPYMAPNINDIVRKKIEVHYLGYYKKWDPQECFYYASENTGFTPNYERTEGSYSKYSSIDDKVDPFHYYTTLIKFGLGRASYDAAQEIRNNKISREEGISLVKKFDLEFPRKYFHEFLNYISISEDEFFKTVDSFRTDHLWVKNKEIWELRNPIWKQKQHKK